MRKLLALASATTLAAAAGSMVMAQDTEEVSRDYDLGGFDEVSAVGPHHVVIAVGPSYSVRFEGPRQTLEDTVIDVEDGRLKIHPVEDERWERRRSSSEWREYWDSYRPGTVYVTLPAIVSASLAGGGDMTIDRVEGAEFAASVAGSGDLDVAALRVGEARFSIAGSGDLTARGSASRSHVSIAGSGNLRARDMTSAEATVSVVGGGDAALTVDELARVSIIGSGDVEIAGAARCSITRMGGGTALCANVVHEWPRS
jgi:hypothetical protein